MRAGQSEKEPMKTAMKEDMNSKADVSIVFDSLKAQLFAKIRGLFIFVFWCLEYKLI